MTTSFPSLTKPLPLGAAASVRLCVNVVATANVGSNGARSHGAAGSVKRTANLAVSQSNKRKAKTMTTTNNAVIANGSAAANVAALTAPKTYTDEQNAFFGYADAMADNAANGAPIRFIASLIVANTLAPELLVARGKADYRVARMAHAVKVFGSERTAFRYFGLATDYIGAYNGDAGDAMKVADKAADGSAIVNATVMSARATDLLVAMMKGRGFHSMNDLTKKFRPAKEKTAKGTEPGQPAGEPEAAPVAPTVANSMTEADRVASIIALLNAGPLSEAGYQMVAAAIVAAKPVPVMVEAAPEAAAA